MAPKNGGREKILLLPTGVVKENDLDKGRRYLQDLFGR
jgi:hypothetical protein